MKVKRNLAFFYIFCSPLELRIESGDLFPKFGDLKNSKNTKISPLWIFFCHLAKFSQNCCTWPIHHLLFTHPPCISIMSWTLLQIEFFISQFISHSKISLGCCFCDDWERALDSYLPGSTHQCCWVLDFKRNLWSLSKVIMVFFMASPFNIL